MPTDAEYREAANAEPSPNPNRVTVLYADFGKRKTTTACSMVKERGLLLSSDASWKVLLNPRHADLLKRVKSIEIESLSQLDYIDFKGFDTIIWDPVSAAVAKFQDLVLDKSDWGGKFREKLISKDSKNRDLKDISALAPVDYLVTRNEFRPVFERLFQHDAHIIFTSHVTKPISGLSKKEMAEPRISAATFEPIGQRADLIVNLRAGALGKFVADMSENSLAFLGKSRIEGLQGIMNLDDFVATYKEIVF